MAEPVKPTSPAESFDPKGATLKKNELGTLKAEISTLITEIRSLLEKVLDVNKNAKPTTLESSRSEIDECINLALDVLSRIASLVEEKPEAVSVASEKAPETPNARAEVIEILKNIRGADDVKVLQVGIGKAILLTQNETDLVVVNTNLSAALIGDSHDDRSALHRVVEAELKALEAKKSANLAIIFEQAIAEASEIGIDGEYDGE